MLDSLSNPQPLVPCSTGTDLHQAVDLVPANFHSGLVVDDVIVEVGDLDDLDLDLPSGPGCEEIAI